MPWVPATLLLHHGHGPLHADLILGTGPRCTTVRLATGHGRWQATLGVPHRRRYLTYRGPVSARGAVGRLWHGRAWCIRSGFALRCRLFPNPLLVMKMRRTFHAITKLPLGPPRGRGELVVPLHRTATLPRS